ncbi:PQQ-binding-like beta-propeller repeat protein [Aeoliella sp.]|uniref:PQQ-binding-like beta-propeller repeat protein n=1 Tax=Aeoliella sp. TaxID=2795800 RepID=UPI003CCBA845
MHPTLTAIAILLCTLPATAEEWTRFRGPNGTGVAPPLAIPDTWTESDFAWHIELPGTGHGSPVIWDDQLFITSGDQETGDVYFESYNVATGDRLWRNTGKASALGMHTLNAFASTTPTVDGERVYFTYYNPGNVTLVAYTLDGQEVWSQDLGDFTGEHGFSISPIVVDGMLYLQNEDNNSGYLLALDAKTGDEAWRVERRAHRHAYSTPATMTMPDGTLAIVFTSQASGITAVDAKSGEKLWQFEDVLPDRTVNSPIVAGDIVVAGCGSGTNGKQLIAYQMTTDGPQELYRLNRNVPNVPTGIVVDDLLFLIHERGTMSCLELATSEKVWTKRLGGRYYCSPILLGDRLLCISMEGEAIMLSAGREFKELGRTDLGEGTQATPAVADGRLFIRTASKLYCLQEK